MLKEFETRWKSILDGFNKKREAFPEQTSAEFMKLMSSKSKSKPSATYLVEVQVELERVVQCSVASATARGLKEDNPKLRDFLKATEENIIFCKSMVLSWALQALLANPATNKKSKEAIGLRNNLKVLCQQVIDLDGASRRQGHHR